jgi:glycine C-acetyltransferase
LWTITNALQSGLREAGLDLGETNSCVTPVYMKGGVAEATNVIMDLRENNGIFCSIVVYPVIPKDMILLRLIPTARTHHGGRELHGEELQGSVKEKLCIWSPLH